MIIHGDPVKPGFVKEPDRCLDPQLWHACAGGMVDMPQVNSTVYYFLQGHAEHAHGGVNVDFAALRRPLLPPPLVLCRVAAVKFLANPLTDEVFAKLRLVPLDDSVPGEEDPPPSPGKDSDVHDKPASFAKTLTQSDANNGGGFSVPRYCAETIFPRLDYNADPPVQTVLAKDVHGEIWKFRHIYRGTPRRHLLTTGWSTFVNQKKLVAGDSIVFLRTDNGDLCIGIRRAKRGFAGGPEPPSGWTPTTTAYAGFSSFLKSDGYGGCGNPIVGKIGVRPESVVEAATLAAGGQPFEVVYYPRASAPEFCVKASAVRAAMRIQWCSGMRFKMAFETEDSSRISWFMGTISSVQAADPIRWPSSPWRLLQVIWDEPDLLQNVKRVSPWLVELVSNMPSIHLAPFSPSRKKPRGPQPLEFPHGGLFTAPFLPSHPLLPSNNPLCCLPDSTPASIQGARHAQFGLPLTDLQLNKLQSGFFRLGGTPLLPTPPRISAGLVFENAGSVPDDVSCTLTIGNASQNSKKPVDGKTPLFVLFGQPILTEEQLSQSSSGGAVSPGVTGNSGSCGSPEKATNNGSELSPCDGFLQYKTLPLGLETSHCKVFLESEDVGRTLDLSTLCSYEELYMRLADMFSIRKSEMMSHVFYRDSVGDVKHTGDEPFGKFMKTARRLMILMDSGSGD